MSMKLPLTYLPDGSISIQEYSIADYTEKLQEVFQMGYEVNFEDNASYPQQIGSLFYCKAIKVNKNDLQEQEKDTGSEVLDAVVADLTKEESKKPGRKPKV